MARCNPGYRVQRMHEPSFDICSEATGMIEPVDENGRITKNDDEAEGSSAITPHELTVRHLTG